MPVVVAAPAAPSALSPRQSLLLDATRGLAALAVLLYHIRYRMFADYSEALPGLTRKVFYTTTAFGHDAVMVFFVLSGFLISRSVIAADRSGRWSWGEYAVARLSRLMVVLVPGVLLTVAWDAAGLHWFGTHPVYTGAPAPYWHDFHDVASRLQPSIVLGNLCFLQSILVPTVGSNDALWSLSFEFWYYVAFPLVWRALAGRGAVSRLSHAAIAALVLVGVGPSMRAYALIWLLGTLLVLAPRSNAVARHAAPILAASALAYGALLVLLHTSFKPSSMYVQDVMTGIGFAVVLYVMLHDPRPSFGALTERVSSWLAGQSYSLYVAHLPVLVFFRAWLAPTTPWQATASGIWAALLIAVVCLVYTTVLAALTEHRTAEVRAWLRGLVLVRPRAVSVSSLPGSGGLA